MLVVKSWFDEAGCEYVGMEGKSPLFIGRSPFLAIELFSKFGFDHRTAKPEIFSH
jgi:hypothetical protein